MRARQLVGLGLLVAGVAASGYMASRRAERRPVYSFRGRVVLITGGSRGLGLLMARLLVWEGARVAICARNEDEIARAVEMLGGPGRVLGVRCDVRNRDEVAAMVERVRAELGPIEVLINNAGVIRMSPAELVTEDDLDDAIATHLWGPVHTVGAVVDEMRRRGAGRIVNVASIGGLVNVPHLLAYCTSKFALVGYSQGLRAELADDGIVVTTACPGLMRTGSMVRAEFKGRHPEEYAWFSVRASAPGLTISGERAAREIVEACRKGVAQVTLSMPAKAAAFVSGVAPNATAGVLRRANRMLPEPGGIGEASARGMESESMISRSVLTKLGRAAAARNNELPEGSAAAGGVG